MTKKIKDAGAHMTTNHAETPGKRVLNRVTDKNSRQIIDAERYFSKRIFRGFAGVLIDCDTLQAAREERTRHPITWTHGHNYIEVA